MLLCVMGHICVGEVGSVCAGKGREGRRGGGALGLLPGSFSSLREQWGLCVSVLRAVQERGGYSRVSGLSSIMVGNT